MHKTNNYNSNDSSMKKLLIILTVLLIGAVNSISAEVVRNGESPKSSENTFLRSGNTFETVQFSDIVTPYNWKDKDGNIYPVYVTKKGACYIKRISKKTGQEYKYYLPKEVQEQIRRELGM